MYRLQVKDTVKAELRRKVIALKNLGFGAIQPDGLLKNPFSTTQ